MFDVSVIICCHNPRPDYLQRTLEALRNQTLPQSQWELLLVDNASNVQLASTWDLTWHPNARHLLEGTPGLTSARECGIREANAELLVFVDDDNVLDPGYLAEATRIAREWPLLGVWGSGSLLPEFEREPSEHLKPYLKTLALRNVTEPRWSNVFSCADASPCGAGLCLRPDVAHAYCKMLKQSAIHTI